MNRNDLDRAYEAVRVKRHLKWWEKRIEDPHTAPHVRAVVPALITLAKRTPRKEVYGQVPA